MITATGRHRRVAANFERVAVAISDWDASTPVREWVARDVVEHLVGWFPPFLEAGSAIELGQGADPAKDPIAAWQNQTRAVQEILDAPRASARKFAHPRLPECPLPDAIDRFYTTDVLMHTWDLARSNDVDHGLDPEECASILVGMEPQDEILRQSGHYGPRRTAGDDDDAVAHLMAFIGRDPSWRPSIG